MAVQKENSELLASIRGKPAQVVAACVPIQLALGADGIPKIGEVLDAYFGVDGCDGLLSAICDLIHGRRGHKPMLEYSMGVSEVVGRIDLQGVVIDQRVSRYVLLKNSDLSVDQKAVVLATTNRDVSPDSHGSGAVSLLTDSVMRLALPLEKAKTPIGRVGTKVVVDVAGEVMAELPVFFMARPVTSLLTVGRRLGTKVARASPLLLMLRKCRMERRMNWSLKTHRCNMGVPMLVCATWPTLVWMWAFVVCCVCSHVIS